MSKKHSEDYYREVSQAFYIASIALVSVILALAFATTLFEVVILSLAGGCLTVLLLRCLDEID